MPSRLLLLLTFACALVACGEPQGTSHAAQPVDAMSLYQIDTPFTDAAGATRHLADFQGRPVIAAMIFTHCEYACPRIMADLRAIETELGPERAQAVEFVLISMDSARDTPEVLAAYAQREDIDRPGWTLLHGSPFAVRGIAGALGVRYKQGPYGDFAHSNLITTLDRQGRIAHQLEGLGANPQAALAALAQLLDPRHE